MTDTTMRFFRASPPATPVARIYLRRFFLTSDRRARPCRGSLSPTSYPQGVVNGSRKLTL
jgi:hypothetical protein